MRSIFTLCIATLTMLLLAPACGEEDPLCPAVVDRDGDGHSAEPACPGTPPPSDCDTEAPWTYEEGELLPADCDDDNPHVYPGAVEQCDGEDQDCDGRIDEALAKGPRWYLDGDRDGYGGEELELERCADYYDDPTYVRLIGDCDDADDTINPQAPERCGGQDEDCDGLTDEGGAVDAERWYPDTDGDGYGDPQGELRACVIPEGYVSNPADCDDGDVSIHPGATERQIYEVEGGETLLDVDCDGDVSLRYAPSEGITDVRVILSGGRALGIDIPPGASVTKPEISGRITLRLKQHTPQEARLLLGEPDPNHPYLGTSLSLDAFDDQGRPLDLSFAPDDPSDPQISARQAQLKLPFDADPLLPLLEIPSVDDDCADWVAVYQVDEETGALLPEPRPLEACSYTAGELRVSMAHFSTYAIAGSEEKVVFEPVYQNGTDAPPGEPPRVIVPSLPADPMGVPLALVTERRWAFRILGEPAGESFANATDCLQVQAIAANEADEGAFLSVLNPRLVWDGVGENFSLQFALSYLPPPEAAPDASPTPSEAATPPEARPPLEIQILAYLGNKAGTENAGQCQYPEALLQLCAKATGGTSRTPCELSVISRAGGTSAQCTACREVEGDPVPGDDTDTDLECQDFEEAGQSGAEGDIYACMNVLLEPSGDLEDLDGDGFSEREGDCDDTDPAIHPGVTDRCEDGDPVDNDCDGDMNEDEVPEIFYRDKDEDGFGDPNSPTAFFCVAAGTRPAGFVKNLKDCDDANPAINPQAVEQVGSNVDEDCDGIELCYLDEDGDGFTPDRTLTWPSLEIRCDDDPELGDRLTLPGDCDDNDALIHPDALEICDPDAYFVDEDCDGSFDGADAEGALPYYRDRDLDRYGDANTSVQQCWETATDNALERYVLNDEDCDDTNNAIKPGAVEVCDTEDNDCDGFKDDADPSIDPATQDRYYPDADRDGHGSDSDLGFLSCVGVEGHLIETAAQARTDCRDDDRDSHPGARERCDDLDNDCDERTDESADAIGATAWHPDNDGDSFHSVDVGIVWACDNPDPTDPPIYKSSGDDCDDEDKTIHPEAPERVCNGIDDNCDGNIDERSAGYHASFIQRNGEADRWFEKLQAAVSATIPGDSVVLCEGTQHDGVKIEDKSNITIRSRANGAGGMPVITGTNDRSAIDVIRSTGVTLQYLELANTTACKGAGLRLRGSDDGESRASSVTAQGLFIHHNSAISSGSVCSQSGVNRPGRGGGIYCNDCRLSLTDTRVENNRANVSGSGMYLRDASEVSWMGGTLANSTDNFGIFVNTHKDPDDIDDIVPYLALSQVSSSNNAPSTLCAHNGATDDCPEARQLDWDDQLLHATCWEDSAKDYHCLNHND